MKRSSGGGPRFWLVNGKRHACAGLGTCMHCCTTHLVQFCLEPALSFNRIKGGRCRCLPTCHPLQLLLLLLRRVVWALAPAWCAASIQAPETVPPSPRRSLPLPVGTAAVAACWPAARDMRQLPTSFSQLDLRQLHQAFCPQRCQHLFKRGAAACARGWWVLLLALPPRRPRLPGRRAVP